MKNKRPKISIITVCLNAEKTIARTIDSVLCQTYPNIEYILIDGASTDSTLEIIKSYSGKISKIISEKDKGIYFAMNKGISNAIGEYIYFLNSDDIFYDKSVLSNVVEIFGKKNVDIVYGKVKLINTPKELSEKNITENPKIRSYQDMIRKGICHQAIFTKKSFFDKIGWYDTKYEVCADFDWILHALNKRAKIFYYDDFVVVYNYQGYSYKKKKLLKEERLRILDNQVPWYHYWFYRFHLFMRRWFY